VFVCAGVREIREKEGACIGLHLNTFFQPRYARRLATFASKDPGAIDVMGLLKRLAITPNSLLRLVGDMDMLLNTPPEAVGGDDGTGDVEKRRGIPLFSTLTTITS